MLPPVPPLELGPFVPHYLSRLDGDRITVVLDSDAEDWHIDAGPGYSSSQMAALLDRTYSMGYECLDEDTDEILPDGGVRIYLAPRSA